MSIIKSLQEVLNNQEPIVFETKDGSSIHIEPEHAVSLASVHDNMNKQNQEKMRNMTSKELWKIFSDWTEISWDRMSDRSYYIDAQPMEIQA